MFEKASQSPKFLVGIGMHHGAVCEHLLQCIFFFLCRLHLLSSHSIQVSNFFPEPVQSYMKVWEGISGLKTWEDTCGMDRIRSFCVHYLKAHFEWATSSVTSQFYPDFIRRNQPIESKYVPNSVMYCILCLIKQLLYILTFHFIPEVVLPFALGSEWMHEVLLLTTTTKRCSSWPPPPLRGAPLDHLHH